ncbi:hypothetical protein [Kineobactrum salinum]|uniref:Uncharacterized protein n=1 Tax=Kineobactrum salinum TaxID=2708301 RepID=A0A6C0U961_9GAMM|nr:hypothetical protein [Kineobactrum salinum]QIB67145.1 hypothetical protein G3T16_18810 [Kineobactrum salinum]
MWINQPSSLQDHHDLHGTLVLAAQPPAGGQHAQIWFTEGDVISMVVKTNVLSLGWPEHLRKGSAKSEPAAWRTEDYLTDRSATTYDREVAKRWVAKGWPVEALWTK